MNKQLFLHNMKSKYWLVCLLMLFVSTITVVGYSNPPPDNPQNVTTFDCNQGIAFLSPAQSVTPVIYNYNYLTVGTTVLNVGESFKLPNYLSLDNQEQNYYNYIKTQITIPDNTEILNKMDQLLDRYTFRAIEIPEVMTFERMERYAGPNQGSK